MHRKSDSEATSIDAASSPPRSPRRHVPPHAPNSSSYYYVQSPSQWQHEGHNWASPAASPHHHQPNHYSSSGRYLSYHCPSPPPHHSRESSTTRFSASLKNSSGPGHAVPWRKLHPAGAGPGDDDDDDEEAVQEYRPGPRFYAACFVVSFAVLFTVFSLIIWGASQAYQPQVTIKVRPFFLTFSLSSLSSKAAMALPLERPWPCCGRSLQCDRRYGYIFRIIYYLCHRFRGIMTSCGGNFVISILF